MTITHIRLWRKCKRGALGAASFFLVLVLRLQNETEHTHPDAHQEAKLCILQSVRKYATVNPFLFQERERII